MVTSILNIIRISPVHVVFSIILTFCPILSFATDNVDLGSQVSVIIQGLDLIRGGVKTFDLTPSDMRKETSAKKGLDSESSGQTFSKSDVIPRIEKTITSKKGTVIVFLSARCPCSRSHLARLNILYHDFKNDFDFIGIHSNGNESTTEAEFFFKTKAPVEVAFPIIRDPDSKIANYFGAAKTPHAFIVGPDPKNILLFRGGVDDTSVIEETEQQAFNPSRKHFLRDALIAVQKGKRPAENNVRVLGCKIDRS